MLAALGATLAPFLGAIPGSMITRKNGSMVPAHKKTLMETAQLGLRASLDLPVRWDGVRELFGDERWRQCALPFPLFNSAGAQLGLDSNFFWLPQCQGCIL